MNGYLPACLAIAAGTCIALQAAANSKLRHVTGEPLWATYYSIIGTMLFSTTVMLVFRPAAPSLQSLRSTEWWHWIGGPLGAAIVLSGTFLITYLGAARFIAFVVAGQLLASLFMDHYGVMGLTRDAITSGKVLGALLVVGGMLCIKFL